MYVLKSFFLKRISYVLKNLFPKFYSKTFIIFWKMCFNFFK